MGDLPPRIGVSIDIHGCQLIAPVFLHSKTPASLRTHTFRGRSWNREEKTTLFFKQFPPLPDR